MNKKLASALLAAGMVFGGAAAASAAYDGSGNGPDEATEEVQQQNNQADNAPSQNGGVITVQDTEGESDELEAPGADEAEDGERRGRHGRGGCNLDAAAEVIGIDVEELRSAIDEGQTIAEVAAENGVSPDAVIEALVDDAEERLSAKVEDGRITQNEADDKLVEKTERIEDRVNGTSEEV